MHISTSNIPKGTIWGVRVLKCGRVRREVNCGGKKQISPAKWETSLPCCPAEAAVPLTLRLKPTRKSSLQCHRHTLVQLMQMVERVQAQLPVRSKVLCAHCCPSAGGSWMCQHGSCLLQREGRGGAFPQQHPNLPVADRRLGDTGAG